MRRFFLLPLIAAVTLGTGCAENRHESDSGSEPDSGIDDKGSGDPDKASGVPDMPSGAPDMPSGAPDMPSGAPDAYVAPPPPPEESHLLGVWGSGEDDVWAVGENGSILHYDGAKWSATQLADNPPLFAVWGSGPTDVYAGGEGTLQRYDGQTWTASSTSLTVHGIWGSGPTDVYTVGSKTTSSTSVGAIEHFDGQSWSAIDGGTAQPPEVAYPWGAAFTAVWGHSATDIFVVGYRQPGPGGLPPAGSVVIEPAYIWHYDGAQWSGGLAEGQIWEIGALRAVWGTGPKDVYAVGETAAAQPAGSILHFDGTTWTKDTAAPSGGFDGIWGSGGEVVVVGLVADPGPSFDWAGVWRFKAGAWVKESVPATSALYAVWGSASDDLYVVGPLGLILHYDGQSWKKVHGAP